MESETPTPAPRSTTSRLVTLGVGMGLVLALAAGTGRLPEGLALAAAYFLGAIPFAYVLVRWKKGIDIRTVGSGNVGATNAGRLLGFRYFLLIFALDAAKGFLPTWGFPQLVAAATGTITAGLPVWVALATIVGHNFPVFLGYRGGKGVATSLGALAALDPFAAAAALSGFVVFLLMTRFVSLSSVAGGIAFVGIHFARVPKPFAAGELPMTAVTLLLLVLLIVRHRKNFARIARGTEPKVPLSRRKKNAPTE